jgi:FkbM family methyltransferase
MSNTGYLVCISGGKQQPVSTAARFGNSGLLDHYGASDASRSPYVDLKTKHGLIGRGRTPANIDKKMADANPDDQPFRHYTTKHRVIAWISQNLFDHVTYTVHHGLLKGMRRKGGLAWLPESITGAAGTPEQAFWMNHNLKDLVIYDIGAFHGLLTLFFSRQARQVISYEPNSRNHTRLMENLKLNGAKNVTVRKVGIGSRAEVATMVSSTLMPGGASIESNTVSGLRNSHQTMLTEQISITTLDEDIQQNSLPVPDFVKIDVEGGELAVLLGARHTLTTHSPQLFLEMHGETMNLKRKNVAAVVACLLDLGYRDIRHVESGTRIDAANSAVAAEGHLYCP